MRFAAEDQKISEIAFAVDLAYLNAGGPRAPLLGGPRFREYPDPRWVTRIGRRVVQIGHFDVPAAHYGRPIDIRSLNQ